MLPKKIVGAVPLGLSAVAADAQAGWEQPHRYGRGSADSLFQREDRLAGQIRRMSYVGLIDGGEAGRAWRMLSDARRQTMREAREHGDVLPAHDYQEITNRLNGLDQYLRPRGSDDDG